MSAEGGTTWTRLGQDFAGNFVCQPEYEHGGERYTAVDPRNTQHHDAPWGVRWRRLKLIEERDFSPQSLGMTHKEILDSPYVSGKFIGNCPSKYATNSLVVCVTTKSVFRFVSNSLRRECLQLKLELTIRHDEWDFEQHVKESNSLLFADDALAQSLQQAFPEHADRSNLVICCNGSYYRSFMGCHDLPLSPHYSFRGIHKIYSVEFPSVHYPLLLIKGFQYENSAAVLQNVCAPTLSYDCEYTIQPLFDKKRKKSSDSAAIVFVTDRFNIVFQGVEYNVNWLTDYSKMESGAYKILTIERSDAHAGFQVEISRETLEGEFWFLSPHVFKNSPFEKPLNKWLFCLQKNLEHCCYVFVHNEDEQDAFDHGESRWRFAGCRRISDMKRIRFCYCHQYLHQTRTQMIPEENFTLQANRCDACVRKLQQMNEKKEQKLLLKGDSIRVDKMWLHYENATDRTMVATRFELKFLANQGK